MNVIPKWRHNKILQQIFNHLQLNCHKKGKKIYSCFVDLRKAFDRIPRDILFTKLLKIGINGEFINNIKTIYENDICQVKLDDGLTFFANQGVKQGCILNPLLFNIFLADLTQHISGEDCKPLKIHGSINQSINIKSINNIYLTSVVIQFKNFITI